MAYGGAGWFGRGLSGMAYADVIEGLDVLLDRPERCADWGDAAEAEELYTDGCGTALLLEAERRRLRRTLTALVAARGREPPMELFSHEIASRLQLVSR